MARDAEYERQFLEQVEAEAARRFGINVPGYRMAVERRLELGAERYGDNHFLQKDLRRELLEETPDVAAYAVLEAQKLLAADGEENGSAFHLFETAVHAAAADWHARQVDHD